MLESQKSKLLFNPKIESLYNHIHSQTILNDNNIVIRIFDISTFQNKNEVLIEICKNISNFINLKVSNAVTYSYYQIDGDFLKLCRQFITGKSLSSILVENGPICRQKALEYSFFIMTIINDLHNSDQIVHNIKPENVIISKNDKIFLVDYGIPYLISDTIDSDDKISAYSLLGPEGICNPNKPSTKERDIFQFGLLLFTMLIGKLPWTVPNLPKIMKQLSNGIPIPKEIDEDISNFLNQLLLPLPELRPNSLKCLEIIEQLRKNSIKNFNKSSKIAEKSSSCKSFKSLGALLSSNKIFRNNSLEITKFRTRTNASMNDIALIESFKE